MERFIGGIFVAVVVAGLISPGRAADVKDAKPILDKAIKALGGEEKLSKVKTASWKSKGTITFGGNDNEFTAEAVVQSLDHFRNEFEGEFGGNKVKGVTVLAGDKGWRKFGDNQMELDKDGVANEKRMVYLTVIPITIVPLNGKGFKVEAIKEESIGGKPAAVIKATGPDDKDFTIYFDKESGLPVKLVAKVVGFMGDEYTQETTFSDYKELGGINKATKIQSKRDGEKFVEAQITEFTIRDRIDPNTFAEP